MHREMPVLGNSASIASDNQMLLQAWAPPDVPRALLSRLLSGAVDSTLLLLTCIACTAYITFPNLRDSRLEPHYVAEAPPTAAVDFALSGRNYTTG